MSTPMETIIKQKSEDRSQTSGFSDETLSDFGFSWREESGVRVLISNLLENAGFRNGFSTRLGGVSPFPENDLNLAGFGEDSDENIAENRKRFMRVFDENFMLTTVWQIHSDCVKVVKTEQDAANTEEKCDALVSDLPNILAGVKTADCVPVLMGDPKTGAYGAVHAGWRGTVESIVIKAFEKMREEFGSKPENLVCAIGPAASCKNYEIGQDVIDAFNEKFYASGKLFTKTREGHALIDLHRANRDQLMSIGVPEQNISTAPFCTMERTDLFFSYRVEKKILGKTGRLMSVIGKHK